jgi:hypothetical protein
MLRGPEENAASVNENGIMVFRQRVELRTLGTRLQLFIARISVLDVPSVCAHPGKRSERERERRLEQRNALHSGSLV